MYVLSFQLLQIYRCSSEKPRSQSYTFRASAAMEEVDRTLLTHNDSRETGVPLSKADIQYDDALRTRKDDVLKDDVYTRAQDA